MHGHVSYFEITVRTTHSHRSKVPPSVTYLKVKPFNPFCLNVREFLMQFQMQDDTAQNFALSAVDEFGNPTTVGLGTPTVTSVSAPTVLTATIQPDNSLQITPTSGVLGTCQVVISIPVGGSTLTGELDITVVSGTAVSIGFTPGATTPVAPPAPLAQAKKP